MDIKPDVKMEFSDIQCLALSDYIVSVPAKSIHT